MTTAGKPVRKLKGALRREQIVQATLRIIARKGVSSLTTAALAREAGISEANLYRHFRNKNEILLATVVQVREMVTANLEKAVSRGRGAVVVLKRFFELQIGLMERNNGIPRLMFSEELHVHPPLRERILRTMQGISERFAALVRTGQQEGTIRKDIDPRTTVLMFVAMVQGIAFRWSLGGFASPLSAEAARTWKNFERLIVTGPSAGRRAA